MTRLAACALLVAAALVAARAARAEPIEPPPEAEGEEFALEEPDSLADSPVEVGFGADGSGSKLSQRRRRVALRDGALDASVRSGAGDPLTGGTLRAIGLGGRMSVGRLRPRWGRGLVLGDAGEPWRSRLATIPGRAAADDDGATLAGLARASSGDGVRWERGGRVGFEAFGGRVARRDLAGVRLGGRTFGVGMAADRGRARQLSLAWEPRGAGTELALDRAGRWQTGVALERAERDLRVALRLRAGSERYEALGRPLAAPPARAATVEVAGGPAALRWRALAAGWRWRPGRAGSRVALEVAPRMPHHAAVVFGFEEQRGARRDRDDPPRWRQAGWGEWRGGNGPVRLGLRAEVWGARAFARGITRTLSAARIEARPGRGTMLAATHTAFFAGRGESVWLPEAGADRWVLRSRTGAGTRTRLEAEWPGMGGRLRASVALDASPARTRRPQWSLDWTGRTRSRAR